MMYLSNYWKFPPFIFEKVILNAKQVDWLVLLTVKLVLVLRNVLAQAQNVRFFVITSHFSHKKRG